MTLSPDEFMKLMGDLETGSKTQADEIIRGCMNYIGCKRTSIDFTLDKLPYRETFVDCFGGTGIILLLRNPSQFDVFNDANAGIAAFYIAMQSDHQRLIEEIEALPHSKELFQWARDGYTTETDTFKRGAMWYYVVQTSFGGRAQCWGKSTQPRGQIWQKVHNKLPYFGAINKRLKNVQIENWSWQKMFKAYDSRKTVWYLDPPYYGSNIYPVSMSKKEHVDLCKAIFELDGFVALAGFENGVYEQYPWDKVYKHEIQQKMAAASFTEFNNLEGFEAKLDRGALREEFLWIKEAA